MLGAIFAKLDGLVFFFKVPLELKRIFRTVVLFGCAKFMLLMLN